MKYPHRHTSHTLEEKSIRFFKQHLPADWNPNSVDNDYGKDLEVEICEDSEYRGLEFIVQLKSSEESNESGGYERQTMRISTYNYLWGNLRVAMVVKYVETEDEAYWILLRDVDPRNQENESFTIYLPRENRLSRIDWNRIAEYVQEVHFGKLDSWREKRKV
jgi:hypothetical protein